MLISLVINVYIVAQNIEANYVDFPWHKKCFGVRKLEISRWFVDVKFIKLILRFPKIYREIFNCNNLFLTSWPNLSVTIMFWRASQPKIRRVTLNKISLILCWYLSGFSDLVLLRIPDVKKYYRCGYFL